jgi:hypothetical protein
MTSQRAATILWPHRADLFCTPHNAHVVVVIIVVFSILINAHILVGRVMLTTVAGKGRQCGYVTSDYERFYVTWWPSLILILTSLLPFLLIVVSNIVLITAVSKYIRGGGTEN